MDPGSRAFFLTVLRYRTLLARDRGRRDELARLRRLLGARTIHPGRAGFEQRAFRRIPMDAPAHVRVWNLDAPAHLCDLSADGARIEDTSGIPDRLAPKARATLHLAPGGSTLRVFLPFEVVHADPVQARYGVRFLGAPLVAQQRIAGTSPALRILERMGPGALPTAA